MKRIFILFTIVLLSTNGFAQKEAKEGVFGEDVLQNLESHTIYSLNNENPFHFPLFKDSSLETISKCYLGRTDIFEILSTVINAHWFINWHSAITMFPTPLYKMFFGTGRFKPIKKRQVTKEVLGDLLQTLSTINFVKVLEKQTNYKKDSNNQINGLKLYLEKTRQDPARNAMNLPVKEYLDDLPNENKKIKKEAETLLAVFKRFVKIFDIGREESSEDYTDVLIRDFFQLFPKKVKTAIPVFNKILKDSTMVEANVFSFEIRVSPKGENSFFNSDCDPTQSYWIRIPSQKLGSLGEKAIPLRPLQEY